MLGNDLEASISSGSEEQGAKVVRKRKGGRRSKTGCITCRVRRVKCDETRPSCTRCTSTGRKCDGFPSIFAPTQPWELVSVSSAGSVIRPSTNPRVASNDLAARSYKFFERTTTVYLTGVFESDLWGEVILRAAQHCDAIFYATIALGAAHETHLLRREGIDPLMEDWMMQQYNKAIRSLTQYDTSGQPPVDVMVASSVLFMGFEMLRREHGKAISHIRSGINMFGEHCAKLAKQHTAISQSGMLIPLDNMEDTLRQLELQLCELSMDRSPVLLSRKSLVGRKPVPGCDISGPVKSRRFNSISEARKEMDGYWHDLMFTLHEMTDPAFFDETTFDPIYTNAEFEAKSKAYHAAFTAWSSNFSVLRTQLESKPEGLASSERKALAVLDLHYLLGIQFVENFIIPNECIWDRCLPRFEYVVDLCDLIAGCTEFGNPACDMSKSDAHCGFQLDMGIVAASFHVLWKCRDAPLRDRVLRLLRKHPRQEGLWDGTLVAQAGVMIDELERGPGLLAEAAARGDGPEKIPGWARVRGIDVKFSSEGRDAVMSFIKQRSEEDDTLIIVKRTLSW